MGRRRQICTINFVWSSLKRESPIASIDHAGSTVWAYWFSQGGEVRAYDESCTERDPGPGGSSSRGKLGIGTSTHTDCSRRDKH
mmetsp:Transcript_141388/g.259963  ORF Transcript_141388/g.259963 Transcript_141388/m.259963 type:complete len:84 (-) Transcript_141388:38-289(-)